MFTRVLANSIWDYDWFRILMLLLIFGLIVLIVWLLRRYAPAFKSTEKPKSDKEIAEEEVRRMTRPVEDDETAKQMEEKAEELNEKSKKPEVKDDTLERSTRPVENDEAAKQMEE